VGINFVKVSYSFKIPELSSNLLASCNSSISFAASTNSFFNLLASSEFSSKDNPLEAELAII
jgi:hypothetical protein